VLAKPQLSTPPTTKPAAEQDLQKFHPNKLFPFYGFHPVSFSVFKVYVFENASPSKFRVHFSSPLTQIL
jgi:hypothetical protein